MWFGTPDPKVSPGLFVCSQHQPNSLLLHFLDQGIHRNESGGWEKVGDQERGERLWERGNYTPVTTTCPRKEFVLVSIVPNSQAGKYLGVLLSLSLSFFRLT